jgi:hypothetical protein
MSKLAKSSHTIAGVLDAAITPEPIRTTITVTDVTPEPQRFKYTPKLICPVCDKATEDSLVEAAGKQICSDCLAKATTLAAREGREVEAKDLDKLFVTLRAELKSNSPQGLKMSRTDELAAAAWERIKDMRELVAIATLRFVDWMCIGDSLIEGREQAIRLAGKGKGSLYNSAFNDWAAARPWVHGLDKSERSNLYWCHAHRTEIEEWRETLSDDQRASLNHPTVIFRQYRAAHAEPRATGERKHPEPAEEVVARLDPAEIGAAVVREDTTKAALVAERIIESLAVIDAPRTRAIIAKAEAALEGEWAEKDAGMPSSASSPKPEPIFDTEDPPAVIASTLLEELGEVKTREVLAALAAILADATSRASERSAGRLN